MKAKKTLVFLLFTLVYCVNLIAKSELPITVAALSFKENKGQVCDQFGKPRPDILFFGSSASSSFYLRNKGISYQMYGSGTNQTTIYRLDINWLNANDNTSIQKEKEVGGYDNYYSEACPNGIIGVKSYKNITYKNLYEGINLKWYEKNGNIKYDYIVAPGINHKKIQLEIKGAENISIDKNGCLIIKTPFGTITENAPYVTQDGKVLESKWVNINNIISFDITNFDPSKPLVIDPLVRLWGTYYGGSADDRFFNSVIDASGNIYAAGYSDALINIATIGAHQAVCGGGPTGPGPGKSDDAILVKFNSAGVRLWGTYYGGAQGEIGQNCALDPSGNFIAMAGATSSTLAGVIATPGAHQTTFGGTSSGTLGDAFLAVFNSAGIRQWGTYYGGNGTESGFGCNFDINSNVYLVGETTSTIGIASPGAHQSTHGGGLLSDGYIAKFNNTGTRLWATYYGGSFFDRLTGCTSDATGNIYVNGHSKSNNNISVGGAYQPMYAGPNGFGDAVIAKFNSSGTRIWGTYYGGKGDDHSFNCVLDANGDLYVAGVSTKDSQTTITTTNAHQTTFGGGSYDSFLLKLSSGGARLWCTLYGGSGNETFSWCSVDPTGNVYLSGCTESPNNISTPCSYQPSFAGVIDCYLAKFDSKGTRQWGTYYGGNTYDDFCSSSTDLLGNVYLVGWTDSYTGIATFGSHQPAVGGVADGINGDGFLVKFDGCIPHVPNTTDSLDMVICPGKFTVLTTSVTTCVEWYHVAVGGYSISNTFSLTTPELMVPTTFYISDMSCGPSSLRTPVTVSIHPKPVAEFNYSPFKPIVNQSSEVSFYDATYAATVTQWDWYFTNSLSPHSSLQNPSFIFTEAGQYNVVLVVTSDKGCMDTVVKAIEVGEEHTFYIPNSFTPNGDGLNDVFQPKGVAVTKYELRIFNRLGEELMFTNDFDHGWNGFYKGILCKEDIYVWKVNFTNTFGKSYSLTGHVTLLK